MNIDFYIDSIDKILKKYRNENLLDTRKIEILIHKCAEEIDEYYTSPLLVPISSNSLYFAVDLSRKLWESHDITTFEEVLYEKRDVVLVDIFSDDLGLKYIYYIEELKKRGIRNIYTCCLFLKKNMKNKKLSEFRPDIYGMIIPELDYLGRDISKGLFCGTKEEKEEFNFFSKINF